MAGAAQIAGMRIGLLMADMHAICRSRGRLRIAAASGTMLWACAAGAAERPQAYETDAGFDAAPQSLYWYSEGVVALNRDIGRDGFLLRSYGSLAVYQYPSPLEGRGNIDGQLWQLDVMPGYQIVRGASTLGGFVGFDYQESSLEPDDPTNPQRGTATGVKLEGHYYFDDATQPYDISLVGEYSTAFATYYAELRLGARVWDKLFVGPALEVDGATGYDAQRLGGYAKYTFELSESVPMELSIAGGHQFVPGADTSGFGGGAGPFCTLEISTSF
jgi:hypothetical protein